MKLTKRRHADYHRSPAEGRCDDCGRLVRLPLFTNSCPCGADYNWAGQRLTAREFWGEETGEHPADVAGIR